MAIDLLKDEKAFKLAWRKESKEIFSRLTKQAEETGTRLPANSYAEAVCALRNIIRIPGHRGATSARVDEVLSPLFLELYHLAFGFLDSKTGDDVNDDIFRFMDTADVNEFYRGVCQLMEPILGTSPTPDDLEDPASYAKRGLAKYLKGSNIAPDDAFELGFVMGCNLGHLVHQDAPMRLVREQASILERHVKRWLKKLGGSRERKSA